MASNMGRSALALLLLLLLHLVVASAEDMMQVDVGMSLTSDVKREHRHSGFTAAECPGACNYRCSKTAYKKACLFFCQKCCFKCRCVPQQLEDQERRPQVPLNASCLGFTLFPLKKKEKQEDPSLLEEMDGTNYS